MFSQAGLRFDQDLLNNVFFSGRGFVIQFGTGGMSRRSYNFGNGAGNQPNSQTSVSTSRPNWLERQLSKMALKVGRFALRQMGVQFEPLPGQDLDQHIKLEISADEATKGGEKSITYKRDRKRTKLKFKIPPGVKTGTKIRLAGMGAEVNEKKGDLYLHVRVKE